MKQSASDRGAGPIELQVSEDALDRMLQRVRRSGGLDMRQEIELPLSGFSTIRASLALGRSRLRLRSEDAGRIRLELSIRGELSMGFPYPDQSLDLDCHVLVRPRVDRLSGEQLRLSADFARARIADIRIRRRSRIGAFDFDPTSMDPFADDRWVEVSKRVLARLLTRIGRREGTVSGSTLEMLLAPLPRSERPIVEIGDGALTLRVAEETGPGRTDAIPDRKPLRSADSVAPRSPAIDGHLSLSGRHLEQLLRRLPLDDARLAPWRIEGWRLSGREETISIDARIRHANVRWGRLLRARLRLDLTPGRRAGSDPLVEIAGLRFLSPRLPAWAGRMLQRRLAARLATQALPRAWSIAVPLAPDDRWQLALEDVAIRSGRLSVSLRSDL